MNLWQRIAPELETCLYEFTIGASCLQEEMCGEKEVKRDECTM